jgi:single-strand DNA-binding protein
LAIWPRLHARKQKTGFSAYGFHEWSLRFLTGAQAARGPVMSSRTFRLTRSGDRKCRTKKVTHISVATNYNRREGETWKSDPQWHRITLFDKMRDRLTNATIGDLVRITGRIGQSSYQADGRTNYSVDLIADGFAILAKAKVKTVEDDMQE